jgi:hypothetical protein
MRSCLVVMQLAAARSLAVYAARDDSTDAGEHLHSLEPSLYFFSPTGRKIKLPSQSGWAIPFR